VETVPASLLIPAAFESKSANSYRIAHLKARAHTVLPFQRALFFAVKRDKGRTLTGSAFFCFLWRKPCFPVLGRGSVVFIIELPRP
jgi:hypothetical protein